MFKSPLGAYNIIIRGVAQFGSAGALGALGRRFKSCRLDIAGVAQLVEQGFCKALVEGSNPFIGFIRILNKCNLFDILITVVLLQLYPEFSRRQTNRQKLLEYKKTLKCNHCGIQDHRLIEFHHLSDKDLNISKMTNHGYSWRRIQKEINKCIPLCCNCHRIVHWKN